MECVPALLHDGQISPRRERDSLHDRTMQMTGLMTVGETEKLGPGIGSWTKALPIEIGKKQKSVRSGSNCTGSFYQLLVTELVIVEGATSPTHRITACV